MSQDVFPGEAMKISASATCGLAGATCGLAAAPTYS
jgi:hypothetical protein